MQVYSEQASTARRVPAEVSGVIHVWVPGIREGTGGIQAFSRVYVTVLRDAFPRCSIRVFIKNDTAAPGDPLRSERVTLHTVSHLPGWLRTPALALLGVGFGLLEHPLCSLATHLHFLPALRILRFLNGTPMAAVLHGVEAWTLSSRSRISALRAADHLTAVSRFTRDRVVGSFHVDPARVSVVPNTFDGQRYTPGPRPDDLMQRYHLKPGQPVLMTVSRLAHSERDKGHRQVLAALPAILKRFPDARYLVVGDGDGLPELRDKAAAMGLERSVIFTGHVPSAELPGHYRLCDVFVMPSIKEGFGIVYLEAMACGRPVIAGCLDGSVDALDDGRLGVLVNPHDVNAIAEAVCSVLDRTHPNRLIFDAAALRAAVAGQFGHARVSRMLAEDLASVVGHMPPPQSP